MSSSSTLEPLRRGGMPRELSNRNDHPDGRSAARLSGPASGALSTEASAVECRSLWKIFGGEHVRANVREAIVHGQISVDEARDRHGCFVAVQDVSFSVGRGEVFCVMGLSGSGKSTLIRHINRLVEPSAGEVLFQGQSIRELDANQLRALRANRIGMVFQNMALLPHRNVAGNVGLPLELKGVAAAEIRSRVGEVLSRVGLGGCENRALTELSGGMQQRVGLARALTANPDVLLMDEPFSALDPIIRGQLQEQFAQLARELGKTVIFITHDLDEAIRIGDRIAIMKDGRFIQVGTPEEIVLRPAHDFVAAFVRTMPRVHLMSARHLMQQPALAHSTPAAQGADAPMRCVGANMPIAEVLGCILENEGCIGIVEHGVMLGCISRESILAAIRTELSV